MNRIDETRPFKPVNIAVLTVSDTRTLATDKSGETLVERIARDGHVLVDRAIVTEVPGVRKEDLQIQVKGNTIRIAGNKSVQYGERASLQLHSEAGCGTTAIITLPLELSFSHDAGVRRVSAATR